MSKPPPMTDIDDVLPFFKQKNRLIWRRRIYPFDGKVDFFIEKMVKHLQKRCSGAV